MPPEFAQQIQQLFARQLVMAFLHHCARLEAPLAPLTSRLEALERCTDPGAAAAARALKAEYLLDS